MHYCPVHEFQHIDPTLACKHSFPAALCCSSSPVAQSNYRAEGDISLPTKIPRVSRHWSSLHIVMINHVVCTLHLEAGEVPINICHLLLIPAWLMKVLR